MIGLIGQVTCGTLELSRNVVGALWRPIERVESGEWIKLPGVHGRLLIAWHQHRRTKLRGGGFAGENIPSTGMKYCDFGLVCFSDPPAMLTTPDKERSRC